MSGKRLIKENLNLLIKKEENEEVLIIDPLKLTDLGNLGKALLDPKFLWRREAVGKI